METKEQLKRKQALDYAGFNSEMFSSYKALDFNKIYLLKVARVLKKFKDKGPKVLDIGCADGSFAKYLQGLGFDVYGIDISKKAVETAKKNGDKAIVHDVSKRFPFIDGFFDIVVTMEVIEHVYDTDYFLSEINRILKTKGKLILTTPNLGSLENRFRLMFGKYPRLVEYRAGDGCSGHIRNYTKQILVKHLKSHGFRTLKVTAPNAPFPVYNKWFKGLNKIMIKLGDYKPFSSLGYQLIILAEKL